MHFNQQSKSHPFKRLARLLRSLGLPTNLDITSGVRYTLSIDDFRIPEAIAPETKDQPNFVNDIAFTPDGRQLASGSINEVVRLWDVATTATLGKFKGQTDKVSSVAISTDGMMIASGSDDASVMVWNMKTREIQYTLKSHSPLGSNSVAFSPNGKLLASGSMDENSKGVRCYERRRASRIRPRELRELCCIFSRWFINCIWLSGSNAEAMGCFKWRDKAYARWPFGLCKLCQVLTKRKTSCVRVG